MHSPFERSDGESMHICIKFIWIGASKAVNDNAGMVKGEYWGQQDWMEARGEIFLGYAPLELITVNDAAELNEFVEGVNFNLIFFHRDCLSFMDDPDFHGFRISGAGSLGNPISAVNCYD